MVVRSFIRRQRDCFAFGDLFGASNSKRFNSLIGIAGTNLVGISLNISPFISYCSFVGIGQAIVNIFNLFECCKNGVRICGIAHGFTCCVEFIHGRIVHLWGCCLGCRLLLGLLCLDNNFVVFFSELIADLVNEFALCVLFRISERIVAIEEVREREDKCDGQDHRNDLSSHCLLRIECPIEYTHFFLQKPFRQPQ